MSSITDITIIGGGINGLLLAREFAKAERSVTVIEKHQTGQESSWAGGGILLPIYPWRQAAAISTLIMQSLTLYPRLARELISATGIDAECDACGLLITCNPDLADALAWCQRYDVAVTPGTAAQLHPFSTHADNPLWLPNISQARNPRLLKALKQDLLQRRVNIIESAELLDVTIKQQRIQRIMTRAGNFAVQQLIMATGAWTGTLWQKLFPAGSLNPPEIYPVKGQMLLYGAPPGLLKFMVLDQDRYLIPRRDGSILAGSTVENQGFDKTTSPAVKQDLNEFAVRLFPPLAQAPLLKHWAGVRPGTAQGIPYIDRHPEIENLAINAGHFRNGLGMAPASAQLLVDLMLHRPPSIAAEPYALTAHH